MELVRPWYFVFGRRVGSDRGAMALTDGGPGVAGDLTRVREGIRVARDETMRAKDVAYFYG